MARQWYYQVDGAVVGPVSGKELKAKVVDGVIVPITPIRQGDAGKWVKASRVKSLFDDMPAQNSPQFHQSGASKQALPVREPLDESRATSLPVDPEGDPNSAATPNNNQGVASGRSVQRIPTWAWIALASLSFAVLLLVVAVGYFVVATPRGPEEVVTTSAAEEQVSTGTVNGEVFVTTKSEDVKRLAGLDIYVLPCRKQFRELLREWQQAYEPHRKKLQQWLDANPEPQVTATIDEDYERTEQMLAHNRWKSSVRYRRLDWNEDLQSDDRYAEAALALYTFVNDCPQTKTGSSGSFSEQLPAGQYFLLSKPRDVLDVRGAFWAGLVDIGPAKTATLSWDNSNMYSEELPPNLIHGTVWVLVWPSLEQAPGFWSD